MSEAPEDLGPRGARLWTDMQPSCVWPAALLLLHEACRIADRLDRLDRQLRGDQDEWMGFRARNEDGSIVRVVMTGALAEARQQQVALKQVLSELRQIGAAVKPADADPPAAPDTTSTGEGVPAGVTDLASWTPARSPKAAG